MKNACGWSLPARALAGFLALACAAGGAEAANAAHPDFTGLWKIASLESVQRSGEYDEENLTPAARQARAFFQKHSKGFEDEAVAHCVPHGLPWSMTSPARDYLHDIYQTKDRITVLFEGMDVYRLIHFDIRQVPEQFTSGPWGYSIAHWEGDTLVIVSTNISAKTPFGFNQRSDKARVTERWRMVQDPKYGKALDIEIIDDDPEVFIKPSRGHSLLVPAAPGTALLPYGCTESNWLEYVDGRMQEIARQDRK